MAVLCTARCIAGESRIHLDGDSWSAIGDASRDVVGNEGHRDSKLVRLCARDDDEPGDYFELCAAGDEGELLLLDPAHKWRDLLRLERRVLRPKTAGSHAEYYQQLSSLLAPRWCARFGLAAARRRPRTAALWRCGGPFRWRGPSRRGTARVMSGPRLAARSRPRALGPRPPALSAASCEEAGARRSG
jgi:hypothetical protein